MKVPNLRRLHLLVDEFRKMDAQFPVQAITTFLFVATHPGCSLTDIGQRCDVSQAGASRNVALLGKFHRTGKPGHDLVFQSLDLRPRQRGHVINLTPKGRKVAETLSELMEPANGNSSKRQDVAS